MSLSTITAAGPSPDDFDRWQVELDTLPPMDASTPARRARELTDQESIDEQMGFTRRRRADREA